MNIDDLTLGQIKALTNMLGQSNVKDEDMGYCIVVLDKGFVYVGEVQIKNNWCVISNARNIRKWGTTKGLGELALNGPLPDTKLDKAGTIKAPVNESFKHILSTEKSLWT